MAAVSWTGGSGNWNTKADWNTGNVPGAGDDVTINTSSVATITYNSGSDTVLSLYLGGNDTLAVSGGNLGISGNGTFYGTVTQSAGTLAFAGAQSYFGGSFSQTGGVLSSAAGTLQFAGVSNSFAATVTAATLNLSSGTDTIAATASLTVGDLQLTGANVTTAENLVQSGIYDQTGGTLSLGAHTLTLAGTSSLANAVIQGTGATVKLTGATAVSVAYFIGAETVLASGTIDQTGTMYVGYFGGDSVSFTNTAAGVWHLDGDATVNGNTGAEVTNLGVLAKTGGLGTAYIYDTLLNTGTLSVASGVLSLQGTSSVLGGVISGAGTLGLAGSGSEALSAGLSLTVADVALSSGTATLDGALTYAGFWDQTGGTLNLSGNNLTLASAAAFEGGVVAGSGTLNLSGGEFGSVLFTGSETDKNTGVISQNNYVYIGYNSSDTVKFDNAAGATYQLIGSQTVYGDASSVFNNAGTFSTNGGGASGVNVAFSNTGSVIINGGTLDFASASASFAGSVSGSGTLVLNSTVENFANKIKLTVASVDLQGGVLTNAGKLTYAGLYSQTGGTLALGANALTLTGTSTQLIGGSLSGSGTLSLKGGTASNYQITGSEKVLNTGLFSLVGYMYVGASASDTANFVNSGAKSVFNIGNDSTLYGYANDQFTNAGTLEKTGGIGVSAINVNLTSTGTVLVATGDLRLDGSVNTLSGKILGAGQLELNAGTDTIATGTSLTVANLLLDGANLTFGGAATYAGYFQQTTGTLSLASPLTLSGGENLSSGTLTGAGTLNLSAPGTIGPYIFSGSAVIDNTSSTTADNYFYVGYGAGDTVKFNNQAGATLTLETGVTVYGNVTSQLVNAGTLIQTGAGSSAINADFSSTGTIDINGSALLLQGTTTTLGGSISGHGTLAFTGGNTTVSAGTTLASAAMSVTAGTVTLAGAQTYAGIYSQSGGTLSVGANTLGLSGTVTLQGGYDSGNGGTLALSGPTLLDGTNAFSGALTVKNTGTLTATASFYVGYNTTDTVILNNAAGGLLALGSGINIYAVANSQITNAGTITVGRGAGTTTIDPAVVNTGSIKLNQGTLSFAGAVSGAGTISQGANTVLAFGAAASGGTVLMGANADLVLNAATFGETISGFALSDVIDLNTLGYSATDSFTYNATHDTLAVSNGSSSVTLQLAGSYTTGSFHLSDNAGHIAVTHT